MFITEVTTHHEDLLTQASNPNALSGALSSVRSGLDDLDNSVERFVANRLLQHQLIRLLQAPCQSSRSL